jgi:hypothetical protein
MNLNPISYYNPIIIPAQNEFEPLNPPDRSLFNQTYIKKSYDYLKQLLDFLNLCRCELWNIFFLLLGNSFQLF